MADPAVWADARTRIATAAAALDIPVVWPNTQSDLSGHTMMLRPEIQSSGSQPIELGGGTWQEDGTVWLHLLVATGTGFDAGNAARHQLGLAFRVAHPISGLEYREIAADPEQLDDDGAWVRLSIAATYRYQTIITA